MHAVRHPPALQPLLSSMAAGDKQTACLRAAAAKVAAGFVDTAAGWVPDSVPRSAAKVGVAVVGALIVFSIVQKVGAGQ